MTKPMTADEISNLTTEVLEGIQLCEDASNIIKAEKLREELIAEIIPSINGNDRLLPPETVQALRGVIRITPRSIPDKKTQLRQILEALKVKRR